MTDLSRLLKLAGLFESVADDPAMNAEIERRLAAFPPDEQTRLLDALDILKNAGPAGMDSIDWVNAVAGLHRGTGSVDEMKATVQATLTNCVRKFDCCVKKIADRRYGWVENRANDGDLSVDPAMHQAVNMQVGLTYRVLDLMRELGTFTIDEVAHRISATMGMPVPQAQQYADHVVGQFTGGPDGTVQQIGPGRYRMVDEKPHTNDDSMNMLRSIANGTFKNGGAF